ncbi:chloride transporter, ClC family [Necator americanus]|uniref:Chloride transporter, ClC family n=1 Tax=Necator americanus TaxID=51031 RepID=W2T773_NECAM|nr:chloride transporter, ClC family [Necator americanus]ETN76832.1 chloride transporter, ClC family [Necator americanus]
MTLYRHFRDDETWVVPFMVWSFYGMVVVIASALAAHFIAPQAIGSGIPEMKTVLRGVILKEYLTIRTLVSKMIALSLAIGSGLPVGKEGPFVHIASVVASQLSRFVHGSESLFENESRANEMLAAGCAVGVACTFSAPVGGVLFSIEVTAVYFAVRSYWRGFFAATCSATLFSVLRVALSVGAHYQTTFSLTNAFTSSELIFVAAIGWLVYPAVVSFLISACMYPLGAGRYLGGEQAFSHTLNDFFVNCSWLEDTNNSYGCGPGVNFSRANWAGPNNEINIFHSLIAFQVAFFFLSIAASTLPIAAGIFMPVFVIGGAFGRFVGE